ncbi:Chromosome segregation protein SMC [uncultured Gammaproteobacteria bacterium]
MIDKQLFQSIKLNGLLSFAPDSEAFEMTPLNVLIGPNGSGKSNLIEAFELLRALPVDMAAAIRLGGGIGEWLWKGHGGDQIARIETAIALPPLDGLLRYSLNLEQQGQRFHVLSESVLSKRNLTRGRLREITTNRCEGSIIRKSHIKKDEDISDDYEIPDNQSIFSQIKGYNDINQASKTFSQIQTFREWSFGRTSPLRRPQVADDQADQLLPDARNLALVLNEIHHSNGGLLDGYIQRFLPRFRRLTTRILGGTVQFYLHEAGLDQPIPATRLSDGTLRFLALLAALHAPTPPTLLCIEEPELGLHPDSLALLAEMLVEASQRMQLVVTTHSDVLISALTDHVESVVVCENNGHGTTLRRLDAGRLAVWLKDYSLGDIWRIGEIGGNL